jgi:hypothetical protein
MRKAVDATTVLVAVGDGAIEVISVMHISLKDNCSECWMLTLIWNFCRDDTVQCIQRGFRADLVRE